eukprot:1394996-Amorphochlora_amoeboformis.AAC.2
MYAPRTIQSSRRSWTKPGFYGVFIAIALVVLLGLLLESQRCLACPGAKVQFFLTRIPRIPQNKNAGGAGCDATKDVFRVVPRKTSNSQQRLR